jgi:hypothetical protein
MVATSTDWKTTYALPHRPSRDEMLEFFGIPPLSMDRLNENITAKRIVWNRKSRSGNPSGVARAEQVLALISRLSEALKWETPDTEGGGAEAEIPDAVFETIAELWRVISDYVFEDEYNEAVQVAREGLRRFDRSADACAIFAWVVATAYNNIGLSAPAILTEGLEAAQVAVTQQPAEPRNWESAVSLLIATSKTDAALAAVDQAEKATGGRVSSMLCMLRARVAASKGQADETMTAVVRAVSRAEPAQAAAVRSEATDLLVGWISRMLPIKSTAELSRYVEMVDVAAWCSYGVPEAEDQVREYRMWAANAGKRVFTGSDRMRSFLAVCTGFISLPIHNYVRSAPAWKAFADGLGKEPTYAFALVAQPAYVQRIHNVKVDVALTLN